MLRTLYFYPCLILNLIYANIFFRPKVYFLNKKRDKKQKDNYTYKVVSSWAKFTLKRAGAKVTVIGSENIPKDKTVLFVSNHQSNFDIPLLLGYINVPKGFIAKKELEKWPFISTWMKYIHCIFMDRSNARKSAEAIVEGINLLKNNYSMVIFPEGTRSKGGPVAEFKAGSFKLATKAKCPIVPVTINGTYKLLEANNNKIKGAPVELVIHKPIYLDDLNKEELNSLHNTVQSIVSSGYKK